MPKALNALGKGILSAGPGIVGGLAGRLQVRPVVFRVVLVPAILAMVVYGAVSLAQATAAASPSASTPATAATAAPQSSPAAVALEAQPSASAVPAAAAPAAQLPAPPRAAVAPRAPSPSFNRLVSAAIGLNLAVVNVRDCSGTVAVPHDAAERNTCAPNSELVYIAGHNPGNFSAVPSLRAGSLVQYWGDDGRLRTYAVRSVQLVSRTDVARAYDDYSPHLVLQTCANADGSQDWVVKAYPA